MTALAAFCALRFWAGEHYRAEANIFRVEVTNQEAVIDRVNFWKCWLSEELDISRRLLKESADMCSTEERVEAAD